MALYKNVNGINIQMTAEEETARQAEEQAWSDGALDRAITKLRERRTALLTETDFYALQDVNMTQDMTNYRQALRDLPDGLSTVEEVEAKEFPTKPGE
tara:strand:- start:40 stop:333 length:294 start_codon:yes stop_codon:yes gene_type:complete